MFDQEIAQLHNEITERTARIERLKEAQLSIDCAIEAIRDAIAVVEPLGKIREFDQMIDSVLTESLMERIEEFHEIRDRDVEVPCNHCGKNVLKDEPEYANSYLAGICGSCEKEVVAAEADEVDNEELSEADAIAPPAEVEVPQTDTQEVKRVPDPEVPGYDRVTYTYPGGQHTNREPSKNAEIGEDGEIIPLAKTEVTELVKISDAVSYLKFKGKNGKILAGYVGFKTKPIARGWGGKLAGVFGIEYEVREPERLVGWKHEMKVTGLSEQQLRKLAAGLLGDLSRHPNSPESQTQDSQEVETEASEDAIAVGKLVKITSNRHGEDLVGQVGKVSCVTPTGVDVMFDGATEGTWYPKKEVSLAELVPA
jgi:Zn finger protein HypA/HybF involved in hydrogenase expression